VQHQDPQVALFRSIVQHQDPQVALFRSIVQHQDPQVALFRSIVQHQDPLGHLSPPSDASKASAAGSAAVWFNCGQYSEQRAQPSCTCYCPPSVMCMRLHPKRHFTGQQAAAASTDPALPATARRQLRDARTLQQPEQASPPIDTCELPADTLAMARGGHPLQATAPIGEACVSLCSAPPGWHSALFHAVHQTCLGSGTVMQAEASGAPGAGAPSVRLWTRDSPSVHICALTRSAYAHSLDFSKAFDSVSHAATRDALEALVVDRGVLQLISMDHVEHARVRILTAHGTCPPIHATQGVPQGGGAPRGGCPNGGVRSPVLFNCCLNAALVNATSSSRMRVSLDDVPGSSACLSALAYADDVVLFAYTVDDMRLTVERFTTTAKTLGLSTNAKKSALLLRTGPSPVAPIALLTLPEG